MRDKIANRRRLDLRAKVRLARLVVAENGLRWSTWFTFYYFASGLADRAFARLERIRRATGVPGLNSRRLNREIWNRWDWAAGGAEWTRSETWRRSLVARALAPYVPAGSRVLEIGPGGGRWTAELVERAGHLTGADISPACVETCRRRFADLPHAEFFLTDGVTLPFVAEGSVDAVWSFDVFVHINGDDVARYLDELARVMAPGARAVVHHGSEGGQHGGWRSDLTTERLDRELTTRGLRVIERFSRWTADGEQHEVGQRGDAVTVFEKPTAADAPGRFAP